MRESRSEFHTPLRIVEAIFRAELSTPIVKYTVANGGEDVTCGGCAPYGGVKG